MSDTTTKLWDPEEYINPKLRDLQGMVEMPKPPGVVGGMTTDLPPISPEFKYANTQHFKEILGRFVSGDELTSEEEKQIKSAIDIGAIPNVTPAIPEKEQSFEPTPEAKHLQEEVVKPFTDRFGMSGPTAFLVHPDERRGNQLALQQAFKDLDPYMPNVVKSAFNRSITGYAARLFADEGEDGNFQFTVDEKWNPNTLEEIASTVLSFAMPLDAATFMVGGGLGKGLAMAGQKVFTKLVSAGVQKKLAEVAVSKAIERTIQGAVVGGTALGTFSGTHSTVAQKAETDEVDVRQVVDETLRGAFLGALIGGTGGLAAPLRGWRWGRVPSGRIAQVEAEIIAFGTGSALLEARAPVREDWIHATGLVLGLKFQHKVNPMNWKSGDVAEARGEGSGLPSQFLVRRVVEEIRKSYGLGERDLQAVANDLLKGDKWLKNLIKEEELYVRDMVEKMGLSENIAKESVSSAEVAKMTTKQLTGRLVKLGMDPEALVQLGPDGMRIALSGGKWKRELVNEVDPDAIGDLVADLEADRSSTIDPAKITQRFVDRAQHDAALIMLSAKKQIKELESQLDGKNDPAIKAQVDHIKRSVDQVRASVAEAQIMITEKRREHEIEKTEERVKQAEEKAKEPEKPLTPESVAKELGIIYNGMQPQAKGKPPAAMFTDTRKGKETSFVVPDLSKAKEKLAAKRKEMDAEEKIKAEPAIETKEAEGLESNVRINQKLRHAKGLVKSLKERINEEGISPEQKEIFEKQMVEAKAEEAKYQAEFEAIRRKHEETEFAEDIGPIMADIAKLETRIQELRKMKADTPELLASIPKEIISINSQIKKMKEAVEHLVENQPDIFGGLKEDLRKIEPIEQMGGGLGFVNPFRSLEQKLASELRKAERKRLKEERKIPTPHPILLQDKIPKDIGALSGIRTPQGLFGAAPGLPARYGKAAQEAEIQLILSEVAIRTEAGKRDEFLSKQLSKVDKKDWGKKGEKFYDHVVDPTKDGELALGSLEAAKAIRQYQDNLKQTIIRIRRDEVRPHLEKVLEREYRQENNLVGKRLNDSQRSEIAEMVEKGLRDRISDSWGIENYLPQMHPGRWVVSTRIENPMAPEGFIQMEVGTAKNPSDALKVAMEHYGNNPEISPDAYVIKGRSFKEWDVLRVNDKNMRRVLKDIADAADGSLSKEEVAGFLRGTIGTKSGKKKFAGFMQKRKGIEGYRKDLRYVLGAQNQQFTRWEKLTNLHREIQPLIDQIRGEGRPNAAAYIEGTFQHLWGKTASKLSQRFDATLQSEPFRRIGIADVVRPNALERWLGYVKGGVCTTFLKLSPRFHLLNSMQRFQTLAPHLKGLPFTGEWRQGMNLYNSKEGKALLERFGIRHIAGGKLLEGGKVHTKAKTREKFGRLAAETFNQEVAFLTMYQKAKNLGLTDNAAYEYGILKGNIYSQFAHLASDTPELLRGPITSTVFQFKRFPIKNIEMGIDLIASKDYSGSAKWLGMQLLLGGMKVGMPAGTAWITYQMYEDIKEEYGEDLAGVVAWGLPSLIGLDMSYSFSVIDAPYGASVPEKIGNVFLGPSGSVAVSVGEAALETKGTQPTALGRAAGALSERVPAFRFLQAAEALMRRTDEGFYEMRDPAGRLKFEADLKEVFIKALAGRTIKEAEMQLLIDATAEVIGQREKVLDAYAIKVVAMYEHDKEYDQSDVDDWNELWPDFPITTEAMNSIVSARLDSKDKDKWERFMENAPRVFRRIEYEREK